MKATLETPLTRLPIAALVWLDGSPRTTVSTWPLGVTFEMRPPSAGLPVLPVYGAAAPDACRQWPTVEWWPPRPPSATYRSPFGPNVSPRGLLKPVANTATCGVACVPPSATAPPASPVAVATSAATMDVRFIPTLLERNVGAPRRPPRGAPVATGRPVGGSSSPGGTRGGLLRPAALVDEPAGDVADLDVGVLGQRDQAFKRLLVVDPLIRHQDPLGLLDHGAAAHRLGHVARQVRRRAVGVDALERRCELGRVVSAERIWRSSRSSTSRE